MGAWGPAVFSDDLACDIRGDYRELLEDEVPDEDATRQVVESYAHLSQDEAHTLWLALAAAQSRLGRLHPDIRDRALAVIDEGVGLELWEEAGAPELRKRKAALAKLRVQLTGPQPARKAVRRPWRHVTDLVAGDVISYETPDGLQVLFRVARIHDTRHGAAPVLRVLRWDRPGLPSRWRLRTVRVAPEPPADQLRSVTMMVSKHRRKDPDWADAGFQRAGRVSSPGSDATVPVLTYTHWAGLAGTVARGWH